MYDASWIFILMVLPISALSVLGICWAARKDVAADLELREQASSSHRSI